MSSAPAPLYDSSFAPPAPAPETALNGPFGLRAGWGILIYVVLVFALLTAGTLIALAASGRLAPVLDHMHKVQAAKMAGLPPPPQPPQLKQSGPMSAGGALINEGLQAAIVLGCAALLSVIERRRLREYFLGSAHVVDLLPGAIVGLASMTLLIALLHGMHVLRFDARLLSGAAMLRWGITWLAVFACVGFAEEYLFRGYLLSALTRGFLRLRPGTDLHRAHAVAFTLASLVLSLLFFVAHTGNGGENAAGLFAVFLAGATFCYALWRTGSLWWGIGFHMTWDWAQSFLFGVADSGQVSAHRLFQTTPIGNPLLSGGSAGPEGSALVIPVLLLVVGVLYLTVRGRSLPLPQPARGLPDPYLGLATVDAPRLS